MATSGGSWKRKKSGVHKGDKVFVRRGTSAAVAISAHSARKNLAASKSR